MSLDLIFTFNRLTPCISCSIFNYCMMMFCYICENPVHTLSNVNQCCLCQLISFLNLLSPTFSILQKRLPHCHRFVHFHTILFCWCQGLGVANVFFLRIVWGFQPTSFLTLSFCFFCPCPASPFCSSYLWAVCSSKFCPAAVGGERDKYTCLRANVTHSVTVNEEVRKKKSNVIVAIL